MLELRHSVLRGTSARLRRCLGTSQGGITDLPAGDIERVPVVSATAWTFVGGSVQLSPNRVIDEVGSPLARCDRRVRMGRYQLLAGSGADSNRPESVVS